MSESWWTRPEVQRDYQKFHEVVEQQVPRWVAQDTQKQRSMSGVAETGWMNGKREAQS
jgi:hypothetical protein